MAEEIKSIEKKVIGYTAQDTVENFLTEEEKKIRDAYKDKIKEALMKRRFSYDKLLGKLRKGKESFVEEELNIIAEIGKETLEKVDVGNVLEDSLVERYSTGKQYNGPTLARTLIVHKLIGSTIEEKSEKRQELLYLDPNLTEGDLLKTEDDVRKYFNFTDESLKEYFAQRSLGHKENQNLEYLKKIGKPIPEELKVFLRQNKQ